MTDKPKGKILSKRLIPIGEYQIEATLYFGSSNQPIDLIMDTGSYLTWVSSRMCVNCDEDTTLYDERNSSTFLFYDIILDQAYGSGDIYGYFSFDQVCIKSDICISDFAFLSAGQVNDINSVNGIVGLSPF